MLATQNDYTHSLHLAEHSALTGTVFRSYRNEGVDEDENFLKKIQPKSCEIEKDCLPLHRQNRMIMTFDDITNDGRLWAGGHAI